MRAAPALVGFLLLFGSLPDAVAQPHPLAVEALDRFEELEFDHWSYTRTTTSNAGKTIERHHASRADGNRWELVLKDGRTPSRDEIDDYRNRKAEERERRERRKNTDDEDVDRSTIRLVDETRDTATFRFRPKAESKRDAKFLEHVVGTLVVRKDGRWVETFGLESTGEIRPVTGVKVAEFRVRMTFRRDETTGDILPESIESRIRGRAFLVKSLDEDTLVRFTDFARPD